MVENNYKKVIILEDDARFSLNFKQILLDLTKQLSNKQVEWELL
jgi:GR25 family glycosyltransferase involved in LPS biosynthesis